MISKAEEINFDPSAPKELTIEDVVEEENPLENPNLESVIEEFNLQTGWETIQEKVAGICKLCEMNYECQQSGK
jgi:hypothetical protein